MYNKANRSVNNLKIIISEEAAKWYKTELELSDGDYVRFYVRYGGVGGNVPGFSVGLSNESPIQIHTSVKVNNITFYIEEQDAWYYEDKNLVVIFNEQLNEPQFTYEAA